MESSTARNETRSMMMTDYKDEKLDKSKELNASMTIRQTAKDEYTRTLENLGGQA